MNSRHCRIVLATVVVVIVGLSFVEPSYGQRRGRGGMRVGSVTPAQLAQLPDVQKELKLTDEQMKKLNSIYEQFAADRGQVMSTIPRESGQRGPKLAELRKKANGDTMEALDGTQQQRLRELLLQVNGPTELYNTELQTALNLTDEQKDAVAQIRRDAAKARQAARADSSRDRWTAMVELQNDTNAKLLKVLTPQQQEKFKQMQGEKMDIDVFSS